MFKDEGREVPILVESDIETREQLENLAIRSSATGSKVLLKDIADIQLTTSTPVIKRDERELSVSITSDVQPGYSAVELQSRLAEELEATDLGDVGISYQGAARENPGVFWGYGCPVHLRDSHHLRHPAGAVQFLPAAIHHFCHHSALAHRVHHRPENFRAGPISFTAMLGMVSLLGMVVNNAIVLIDFINTELREGIHIQQACLIAVDKRFRPILLTTVTTVIGLIPLVVTGGELFQPLAIALMFGLMVSMLLTLIIIPWCSAYWKKIGNRRDLPVDSRQD